MNRIRSGNKFYRECSYLRHDDLGNEVVYYYTRTNRSKAAVVNMRLNYGKVEVRLA